MAAAAKAVPHLELLKLKLGGAGDPERLAAVRAARPDARLIADANEAWTPDMLGPFLAAAAAAGVELIEQPLPAERRRGAGAHRAQPFPSAPTRARTRSADLAALARKYDAVNIKLDKTGGLTEALAMAKAAARRRIPHHGRLDGRDLARRGAGAARGARGRVGRSRRAAAARARPRARPCDRERTDQPACARAWG